MQTSCHRGQEEAPEDLLSLKGQLTHMFAGCQQQQVTTLGEDGCLLFQTGYWIGSLSPNTEKTHCSPKALDVQSLSGNTPGVLGQHYKIT